MRSEQQLIWLQTRKVNSGEIVVEDKKRTGYAKVTFEKTKNEYYVSLIEFKGDMYTVTYDLNGGDEGPKDQVKYKGIRLTLASAIPSRLDFNFISWNTSPEGDGEIFYPGDYYKRDEDLTLYAMWKQSDHPTVYNINYNLDGGGGVTNPSTYTYFTPDIQLNNPSKANYCFYGWTGTGLDQRTRNVVIKEGSRGDREYTANWVEPIYALDDNRYFLTLEEAINQCDDNSTIKVLRDGEDESEDIVNNKNIIIDLDGHSINITNPITNQGTLKIIDNNQDGNTSKIENTNGTCIYNNGTLQIGENDDIVKDNIVIKGETGIVNNGINNFYDGQIIGEKAIKGNISDTPEEYRAISTKNGNVEIVRLRQDAEFQARIGAVYYQTVAKAIESVEENETVTMLMGISLDSTIEIKEKEKFKLDLNGFTITTTQNGYVIKNYCDLEILDSSSGKTGLIEGTNNSTIYNARGASLKINGGKINLKKAGTSTSYTNAIFNDGGNLEINNGTINSEANYSYTVYNLRGNLKINGGTISGGKQTIRNEDYSYKEPTDEVKSYSIEDVVKGDDTYYFENVDGKLVSNNKKVSNSMANSYIELDYSDVDESENIDIVVNAQISSEVSCDYGFAIVNNSKTTPKRTDTEGRFISISGTQAKRDYTTTIKGGKKYYLHIGYSKDGSVNRDEDCFTINSIYIGKLIEKKDYATLKMQSGYIDCDGTGIYNLSDNKIEISGGKIGDDEKTESGNGIYNANNGDIDIKGNTLIYSSEESGSTYGVYNEGQGTITISEEVTITSYTERYGNNSYAVCNGNNGTVIVNGGTLISYSKAGYGSLNGAGISNEGNGKIIVNNGTIYANSSAYVTAMIQGIINKGPGQIEINGGNIYGEYESDRNNSTLKVSGVNNNGDGNIIINGGTIYSRIEYTQSNSYVAYSYSSAILNSGDGQIEINGNADILGENNKKVNSSAICNMGNGIIIANKGNIYGERHSIYATAGTTEINNVSLIGSIQNEGGLIKIINTSNNTITVQGNDDIGTGIINNKGTIELGEKENNNNEIIIIGNNYGINNADTFNYYTGTIKGEIAIGGTVTSLKSNKSISIENDENDGIEIATLNDRTNEEIVENETTGIKYNSLKTAIEDVQGGGTKNTLKILKNRVYIIKEDDDDYINIKNNQSISIDLNGKQINMGQIIVNDGNLELKNSEQTDKKITTSCQIVNNGTLTINEGVNYENIAKETKAIENNGNAYIKGNMSVTTSKSSIIYNNDEGYVEINEGANLNISNNISGYGIFNNGTGNVKVNDGVITVSDSNAYTIYNNGTGNVEINGGTQINNSTSSSGNISSVIYNNGDGNIEINGGTITTRITSGIINNNNGTIRVNNVQINNSGTAIINNSTGSILINGGNIRSSGMYNPAIQNVSSGLITITGGTIDGYYGVSSTSGGTIIIGEEGNGVKTDSPVIIASRYGINTANQYSTTGSCKLYFYDGTIKGKTNYWNTQYTVIEDEFQLNEFEETISNNTYKCVYLVESEEVAEVVETQTKYKSLAKAVENCIEADENDFTIKVLKDCYLIGGINIPEKKNITFDLNEKTMSLLISDDYESTNDIENNGTLKINDGTVNVTYSGTEHNNRTLIYNSGTLQMNSNTTVTNAIGYYLYGVYNVGDSAKITSEANIMFNARYSQGDIYTIYNNNSEININGGDINASISSSAMNGNLVYGVYNNEGGNINITNGSLRLSGSGSYTKAYGVFNSKTSNINISGGSINNIFSSIWGETYGIYNNDTGSINITGGNVNSKKYGIYNKANGIINIGNKDGNIIQNTPEIRGSTYGIYTLESSLNLYDGIIRGQVSHINNGINEIEDSSYIYEFDETIDNVVYKSMRLEKLNNSIARIEETNEEFNSLDDAFNRAKSLAGNEYTIKLLDNCNLLSRVNIENGKSIILDMNEHTIKTYVSNNPEIQNAGTLTLKNGTLISDNNSGTSSNNHAIIDNQNQLHIESTATIKNYGDYVRIIQNENNGSVNINGGNIIADNYNHSTFTVYGIYNIGNGTINYNNGKIDMQAKSDIIDSSAWLYGIYNQDAGNINVTSGNIYLHTESVKNGAVSYYGIYNKQGTVQIDDININNEFKYLYSDNASYAVSGSYAYGIYNEGNLNIDNGNISNWLERILPCRSMYLDTYGIYNSAGNTVINKININNYSIKDYDRHNSSGIYNNSNLNMIRGSIDSTYYGIFNTSIGTANIGNKDGYVNKSQPLIVGSMYGISNSSGILNYYDGTIKGKEGGIYGILNEMENNYIVKVTTEEEYKCAKLVPEAQEDLVAFANGAYFDTIQNAIDSCTNQNKTYNIELINGSTENSITIGENQDIILDLNGHSIISNSSSPVIINNGKLQIIDTGYDESNSILEMICSNNGVAIENNGTKLTIGEITDNDEISTIVPKIKGKTYGIYNNNNNAEINFYDGHIIGETSATNNLNILRIPTGCEIDEKENGKEITLK